MADIPDLATYCLETARRARAAAAQMALCSGAAKNHWLRLSAKRLREHTASVVAANALDLAAAPGYGLTPAETDRLKLDSQRIDAIAVGLEEVAALPDPIGEVIEGSVRPNGLALQKVRVPLGVVLFIYESRPNVTADAAAICAKSGNAVILRGGKEAIHSSRAIVAILAAAAAECGLPADGVQLVATIDRDAVGHFLALGDLIDVAIPRGGEELIRRVAREARMPVIKHFTGNCHVYIDSAANLDMAESITVNSKCQRQGVCNAAESLLIHEKVAAAFVPRIAAALGARGIELRGDPATLKWAPQAQPATEDDYYREYLGPIISVRIVASLQEAIQLINQYGSHHTDAIVTDSLPAAREFTLAVDSAAVMVNASTRLNDGGCFGLGAEIGISTDKFHARGPCGLKELTSYKWIAHGNGHTRQ